MGGMIASTLIADGAARRKVVAATARYAATCLMPPHKPSEVNKPPLRLCSIHLPLKADAGDPIAIGLQLCQLAVCYAGEVGDCGVRHGRIL
jgi:hypothetical protein